MCIDKCQRCYNCHAYVPLLFTPLHHSPALACLSSSTPSHRRQPAHVCHAYVDVVKRACHEGVAGLVNAVARKVTAREVPVPAAVSGG